MSQTHKFMAGLTLAALLCFAGPARGQSAAEQLLLQKAHTLEQSGHIDLAAQSWQQVLLSDPNNQEALAGLARWAKVSGKDALAQQYLDRLRQINPNNPAINSVQSAVPLKTENQMLQRAADLAKAGHNEQALNVFHQAFGNNPPDNWAQAYYDTEATLPATRADAINGLRGMMTRYPGNPQYAIDLGRVLTYDAKTRAEGERILSRYQDYGSAQTALRQAFRWDVQSPGAASLIEDYLKEHPDEELAQELAEAQERQAKTAVGFARTPAEREAFDALAADHLNVAQERFMALNAKQPDNPRVLAGLGFLRMKQNNFGGAISYFEQAEQNGLRSAIIAQSLATSRFWFTMQQGTDAMNGNQLDDAVRDFRAALVMRPGSTDAINGLAGVYMKMQQPAQAIPFYQELLRAHPRSEQAWRGLFMAQAQAGDATAALTTAHRFPEAVTRDLARDPDYLRLLASAYSATGQDVAAQRTLSAALSLPLTVSRGRTRAETLLQYAALLAQDKQYARAAQVYSSMIDADQENISAWQGLVSMEHLAGRDADAITLVERMPPDAYDIALSNVNFLAELAAIYQGQNHLDVAQTFLERAAQIDEQSGKPLSIPLQLQIAAIDLGRNHPDGAYRIYRGVLTAHPDALDAWKGLLAALHATGHDADALAQIQQIPLAVRAQLENDLEYQQTVAAVYAATGYSQAALGLAARIQDRYAAHGMTAPADVAIQTAWLLFNTNDDRDLYQQLMTLGDRTDMTDEQRRQIQTIWASWAQRRAAQAATAGNPHRALDILTAAAKAFPGNPAVSKALAAGYAQAGQPKDAVAIYQSLDTTNATAADYQSMVGAALAAQEMKLAESWLRDALAKYPDDPKILASAARFETARGDNARAAAYWKASLNAMPAVTPATELAHEMDQPDLAHPAKSPTPTDLVSLLNPDSNQPNQSGVALPSFNNPNPTSTLTASNQPYGPDPYYMGTAPVQLQNSVQLNNPSQLNNPAPASAAAVIPSPAPVPMIAPAPAAPEVATKHHRRHNEKEPAPGAKPKQPSNASATFKPDASLDELPLPAKNPSATQSAVQPPTQIPAQAPARQPSAAWPALPTPASSPAPASGASDSYAPLRFSTTPPANIQPEMQSSETAIPEQTPQQLVLDSSPALTPIPSASDETAKQSQEAFAAANRPIDPSLYPTQYEPPVGQIQPEQPVQPQTEYERPPSILNPTPSPLQSQPDQSQATPSNGASDSQLMRENLPPLRGPYERGPIVRQQNPRQEAQNQLQTIEGGYSPWFGGTGFVNHRSGTAGYDALSALEAPFEASGMLGTAARLTVISDPTFLDAGAPTTAPVLPGGTVEQLGTAPQNAVLSQQNAYGIGGEVQLATQNFAVGLGYSPYGFLVSNVIGRLNWKPANGPFIFNITRDVVKDSQLSYAGLRDPGSAGPGFDGNIWGGVVSTGGEVQYGKGNTVSGYYVSGGGQYITGVHVQNNDRVDGDIGAYWHVKQIPDQGNLTVGVNFFGMHYAHNLTYFTYGQGGYFSPQAYFLGNIPLTWQGNYGTRVHYSIVGALGVQAFQEDSSEYFPLDPLLQTANNNLSYPAQTIVSGNYDLHSEVSYHLTDHWFVGGLLSMNNTRSYNNQQVGFYVRFLIRPQISAEQGPTGLYPVQGLRPFMAP